MTPGLRGHIKEYLRTRPDYEVAEFAREVARLIGDHLTTDALIVACDEFEAAADSWIDNYDPTPEVAPVK